MEIWTRVSKRTSRGTRKGKRILSPEKKEGKEKPRLEKESRAMAANSEWWARGMNDWLAQEDRYTSPERG